MVWDFENKISQAYHHTKRNPWAWYCRSWVANYEKEKVIKSNLVVEDTQAHTLSSIKEYNDEESNQALEAYHYASKD